MQTILGIETSCDECSAAVVRPGKVFARAASSIIFSQIELHRRFGGVVPEVASRNHLEMIAPVVDDALNAADISFKDLSAIAVTNRPGLIGALLVGVSTAKAYSYSLGIPLIGVDHLEGHLHSIFLETDSPQDMPKDSNLPLLVCLVSGGHTNLYLIRNLPPQKLQAEKLSESRDDAAGEAFDKTAKLMGLPYPGGIHIDRLAQLGSPKAFDLPRPLSGSTLDFSFSGLKTAVSLVLKKNGFVPHVWGNADLKTTPQDQFLHDLSASIQAAIVDCLIGKIKMALTQTSAKSVAVVGGVSANSGLRTALKELGVPVFLPPLTYCTDNAAMIGAAGLFHFQRGEILQGRAALELNAFS